MVKFLIKNRYCDSVLVTESIINRILKQVQDDKIKKIPAFSGN